MSYTSTKIFSGTTDIGLLLEPRRGTTKGADVKFIDGTTDISNYFMNINAINSYWRSACTVDLPGLYSGTSNLGVYFANRGWVPGATIKYTLSGTGAIAPFTANYDPTGAVGSSYAVKRIAVFMHGGGGTGATLSSVYGGGGGAGASALFTVLDWPSDNQNINYIVGGSSGISTLSYTYSGSRYIYTSPGGNGVLYSGGATVAPTLAWNSDISTMRFYTVYPGGAGGTGGSSRAAGSASSVTTSITLITGLSSINFYKHNGGLGGNLFLGYGAITCHGGGGGGGGLTTVNGGLGGGNGGSDGSNGYAGGVGCGGGGASGNWVEPGLSENRTGGAGGAGSITIYY